MAIQTLNVGMTTGKDSVTMPAYGFRIGLSGRTGSGALAAVLAILAKGTAAAWWTPQSGLIYQENTGTTPATANGDSIGLQLDQGTWGGKTEAQVVAGQPELLTNGDFSSGSGWTPGAGWTISGGQASFSAGTGATLTQAVPTVSGNTYEISFDITAITGGSVSVAVASPGITLSGGFSTLGRKTCRLVAAANYSNFQFSATAGANLSVDNVTMKQVPGYSAQQSSATLKPKLQAGPVARFDGVDDAWGQGLVLGTGLPVTLLAIANITAGASARVLVGATDGTGFTFLGVDSSDKIIGRSGSAATATGGSSTAGSKKSLALSCDGTNNRVYVDAALIDTKGAGGAGANIASNIAAYNNTGTPSQWTAMDLYHLIAIKGYGATAAEIATITNYLNTH